MQAKAPSPCTECGFQNDSKARFCASCGTNLHERCPQCGAGVRARQNFCDACGEPLGTLQTERRRIATPEHLERRISPVQAERKIATVLFADIANSTDVIRNLDPEDAKRFLVPAVEIMTKAVHRYEGIVVRDRGDGIMASFGAPIALEDHAVRACYAALDMQNGIRARAEELARELGVPLEVRVGMNSGPILVTVTHEPGKGREIRIDGVTTHIAARLEPLAVPGTVLIGRDTFALTEGFVEVRELGLRHLKGVQEEIRVYQLDGVNTRMRIQALAARRMTKFVGRAEQIETLRRKAAQAHAGRGQIVALMGEAGIGKSRIVLEFIHSDTMTGWQVLEAGSVSYGKATAYLPIADLLTRYFDIHTRDDEARVRDKIAQRLKTLGEERIPAQLPFFLAALGMVVSDAAWTKLMPIERQRGMFDALKRLLIRESHGKPLCLVFEDLHWVDAETHTFLDTLLDSIPGARILMVVDYRPEHRNPWAGRSYFTELRLEPLPATSAGELLDMLLGSESELDPLKQALIDLTGGNPLFLEESVRSLVETGLLAGTPGQRRALGSLLSGFVPRTIEALLSSRIDRLPAETKEILQCAAVIGYEIPLAVLELVAGHRGTIEERVRELQAAELLYEKTLFPETVYSFKHAITREVVYVTLTREIKKALHAEVARAVVTVAEDRIEEHVERVANHAEIGELHEMALEYLERAGTKAYGLYANREAAEYFERAITVLRHLSETPAMLERAVDVRFELRNALIALSELDRIRTCLEEIESLLARLGDKVRGARHAAFRCNHHFLAGEQRRAIEFGESGLKLADECRDRSLKGELLYRVGQCYHLLGDNRRAITLLEQSIAHTAEPHERSRFELSVIPAVVSRIWLISVLAECGDFRSAMERAKQALAIAETAEHPLSEALGWLAIGHVLRRKGELDGAIGALERGIELCDRYTLPLWRMRLLSSLGIAYACTGRVDEGLDLCRRALSDAEVMRVIVDQPMFLVHIGIASLVAARMEDALECGKQALDLAMAHETKTHQAWARFLIGHALLASDSNLDYPAKELAVAHQLALACEAHPLAALCQAALASVHERGGNAVAARELLTAADAMFRKLDMRPLPLN